MTAGCTSDPWGFAPSPPGPVERTESWTWSVRGAVVGQEERSFGGGGREQWALTRTTFAFREGAGAPGRALEEDRDRWVRRAALVRCTDRGCSGERYGSDGAREQVAGTCAPDLLPVLGDTCVPLGGVRAALGRDGGTLAFDGPLGPVRVGLDGDGHPAWVDAGGLHGERVTEPVALQPVDVGALTAIAVPRAPEARESHVGEFTVGDEPVRIEVPTVAELPARDAKRLARLVDEVAADQPADADCKDHATALVEAARRDGYAARTVFGRVYVDGDHGGWLVFHAWVEVEVGGRWVSADSALRQFPADASHVPLGGEVADLVAADVPVRLVSLR